MYGHSGPKFHNIAPECPNNQGNFIPTVKPKNKIDKSFVFPRDWKSSNSTRDNKQNNVKYNINKINYNRTFNINQSSKTNKSNNIINSHKNRSNNNKVNRPNRSNKKKP